MNPPRAARHLHPLVAVLMAACGSTSSAPSPAAAPVAGPTATPTAPAAPAPTSGVPASCRNLPVATGTERGCRGDVSDFLRQVTDAVSAAQGATVVDPDSNERYPLVDNGIIQSPNAYLKMIVDALDRQGLCAVWDGAELNVRRSNDYNENFDLITGAGGSWIKYMSTCAPATPVPAIVPPGVQDPECRLAPSRDTYCDRPRSAYEGDVVGVLDELIAQDRQLPNPLIFDFRDRLAGVPEGWKITNPDLYFSEMRKRLRTRGYCSIRSAEDELWIKKGTNRFSEHWDLLKAEGYSLRVMAAACHDAAF